MMQTEQHTLADAIDGYTAGLDAPLSCLPRLVYIGDVPVEPTVYGCALLYRLLSGYPKNGLRILEGNPWRTPRFRRLPGVTYEPLQIGNRRLISSRLSRLYGSWLLWKAEEKWRLVDQIMGAFKPEAVLTVTNGFSWLTASAYAERRSLPLHLILHDEWVSDLCVVEWLRPKMELMFERYYRQAASRLCVSPYMAQQYQKQYKAPGEILYPSRAPDVPCFDTPPSRLLKSNHNPVFAYGGTINFAGYPRLLRQVAEILASVDGKLLIFGPLGRERAKAIGLDLPNIVLRGMTPSEKMIHSFREEADALILPMSFESQNMTNMRISFPSKLTDYTASGVPILIYGPRYCSAVRWARETPGVAAVVDVDDATELSTVIKRLCEDGDLRWRLGAKALEAGKEFFSSEAASKVFYSALIRGSQNQPEL